MYFLLFYQTILGIVINVIGDLPLKHDDSTVTDVPPGHLKAFGYHRPSNEPVVEERGFLHPKVFWEKYVSIHKPMVFRQAAANSLALQKWSDEYLDKEYGDLDVLLEVKRENRSTRPKRVNISTFINIYTKEDVYAVTVLPDPMRKDVQVPSCLLCGTFREFVHETNFWMSSGGTRSVIHYDADENIHCIMNGSKDFMMIDKAFKKYLPMVEKSPLSGSEYSSLDPDAVDLVSYPDVAKVQWTYATLYPGDCIYIPAGNRTVLGNVYRKRATQYRLQLTTFYGVLSNPHRLLQTNALTSSKLAMIETSPDSFILCHSDSVEYLHQVRSYSRTISATMLFTSSVEKTFVDEGCEKEHFQYTPLSDIDVHWTYNKGDKTIDMGYINVEVLRSNLLTILHSVDSDFPTARHLAEYYFMVSVEESDLAPGEIESLFSTIFDVDARAKITEDDIKRLPREKLKILARRLDDPHGPVKTDDEENPVSPSERDEL